LAEKYLNPILIFLKKKIVEEAARQQYEMQEGLFVCCSLAEKYFKMCFKRFVAKQLTIQKQLNDRDSCKRRMREDNR
jgi:hypothetical protein